MNLYGSSNCQIQTKHLTKFFLQSFFFKLIHHCAIFILLVFLYRTHSKKNLPDITKFKCKETAFYFDILDLLLQCLLQPFLELLRLVIIQASSIALNDCIITGILLLGLFDADQALALVLVQNEHDSLVVGLK